MSRITLWSVSSGKTARYRLVVSDHENVALYYRNGKEVWG